MRELCEQVGYALSMYPVLENDRKLLIEWFKGEFEIDADRGDFDYIYTVEKLASLRGKKLQVVETTLNEEELAEVLPTLMRSTHTD